jgi:hypothetical protein
MKEIEDQCVAVDVLGFRERVRAGQLGPLADQLDKLARDASAASITWAYTSTGPDSESHSGRETGFRSDNVLNMRALEPGDRLVAMLVSKKLEDIRGREIPATDNRKRTRH